MNNRDLKVGDQLYMVEVRWRGEPTAGYVVITKVGRKYLTVVRVEDRDKNFKHEWVLERDTLCEKSNYTSNIGIYLSREDYDIQTATNKAWAAFRVKIDRMYQVPTGMTLERIQTAAIALGIDLEGSK